MTEFTEKKQNGFKRFFGKVWCMLKNNWQYKLLALATAFIMWLLLGYIV